MADVSTGTGTYLFLGIKVGKFKRNCVKTILAEHKHMKHEQVAEKMKLEMKIGKWTKKKVYFI